MPKRRKKRKKNKNSGPKKAAKRVPWYQYYLPRIRFFIMLTLALIGLGWMYYKVATTGMGQALDPDAPRPATAPAEVAPAGEPATE